MAQEGIPFGVADTFSVSTWGRLSPGDIARRGIDVLMGIVRSYHADCGDPLHFWCAPEGIRVFVMADLYQSGNEQGEHYIGCYLRGADFDNEGVPTIHETPSLKMLMQLMDDGRVFVHFGPLSTQGSDDSMGGIGLLDQRVAQRLPVIPWPVPNVPDEPGEHITFVLQRIEDTWYVAHFPHNSEFPERAHIRVFATLPVKPDPSPHIQLEINDFPAQ